MGRATGALFLWQATPVITATAVRTITIRFIVVRSNRPSTHPTYLTHLTHPTYLTYLTHPTYLTHLAHLAYPTHLTHLTYPAYLAPDLTATNPVSHCCRSS